MRRFTILALAVIVAAILPSAALAQYPYPSGTPYAPATPTPVAEPTAYYPYRTPTVAASPEPEETPFSWWATVEAYITALPTMMAATATPTPTPLSSWDQCMEVCFGEPAMCQSSIGIGVGGAVISTLTYVEYIEIPRFIGVATWQEVTQTSPMVVRTARAVIWKMLLHRGLTAQEACDTLLKSCAGNNETAQQLLLIYAAVPSICRTALVLP